MSERRKILISPGFGAGWTTWNSGEVAKLMLTYQPVIEAIESKQGLPEALKQLQQECKERFGQDYVCVLGAEKLEVVEVEGRVRIDEYDGSESCEVEGEFDGWM